MAFIETLAEALQEAVRLIVSGDPMIVNITIRSIYVSGLAILLASLWSIPIATVLGLKRFHGRRLIQGTFNSLIGIPTVALGLLLYLLLSRSGPLGIFEMLYTVNGIAFGQAVLITPIIVSFVTNALESVDTEIKDLSLTLGASELKTTFAIMKESNWGIILALITAFNRAIAELGIALMVGGNIKNYTRVLTTTIALETAKGEIPLSIALALILLAIVFIITLTLNLLRRG
jgi:tungstate transport system permease protein